MIDPLKNIFTVIESFSFWILLYKSGIICNVFFVINNDKMCFYDLKQIFLSYFADSLINTDEQFIRFLNVLLLEVLRALNLCKIR